MSDIKDPDQLWKLQKAKLKLMFSEVCDEDLHFDYGKKEAMMTHLQRKLGKSREELNLLLSKL